MSPAFPSAMTRAVSWTASPLMPPRNHPPFFVWTPARISRPMPRTARGFPALGLHRAGQRRRTWSGIRRRPVPSRSRGNVPGSPGTSGDGGRAVDPRPNHPLRPHGRADHACRVISIVVKIRRPPAKEPHRRQPPQMTARQWFVADDPIVTPGWDIKRRPRAYLELGAVIHSAIHGTRQRKPHMMELAAWRPGDGAHMLRPPPARIQQQPTDHPSHRPL